MAHRSGDGGRSRGLIGTGVWVKMAGAGETPPIDPGDFAFLLPSTRAPVVATFSGEDGGKTAHHLLGWLSTRGEAGPWSEKASATIGP
ncbi:MAG: hypothetical protein JXQ75_18995 [Phycisphaerae bacterium]|nr:hypothetical protein [Phycisphaerae bacterium]